MPSLRAGRADLDAPRARVPDLLPDPRADQVEPDKFEVIVGTDGIVGMAAMPRAPVPSSRPKKPRAPAAGAPEEAPRTGGRWGERPRDGRRAVNLVNMRQPDKT